MVRPGVVDTCIVVVCKDDQRVVRRQQAVAGAVRAAAGEEVDGAVVEELTIDKTGRDGGQVGAEFAKGKRDTVPFGAGRGQRGK